MTIVFPEGVKSQGRTALGIGVSAPADPMAPKLSTDLALAAAGLNASCYVFGEIEFTTNVNKGEAPRRLCSSTVLQEFGNKSHQIGTIQIVWDPQEDDTDEVNAAKALLADGAELWFYIRRGPDAQNVDFAVGDRVEVRHVRVDGGRPGRTGDGEFDQFSWQVDAIDIEPPKYDAVLVA